MRKLSIFMALALTLLAACKSPTDYPVDRWKEDKTGNGGNKDTSSLPVSAIVEKEWRLVSFEEFGKQPETVPTDIRFTMNFHASGNGGGMADRNSYGVRYISEKAGLIRFFEYISTAAAPGPLETRYVNAIQSAESYWTDGKTLFIEYDKGSKRLNFELSVTTQQPDNILGDTEWQLESFETFTQGKQFIPSDENYTLSFDKGNRAYGQINCNTYVTNYAVYVSSKSSGIPIRFTDFGASDIDCQKYSLAGKFEEAMKNATEFLFYKDQLTIDYSDANASAGATRMNFVRISPSVQRNPLVNTGWKLIQIDNNGAVSTVDPREIYTLEFTSNQEGKGVINCNDMAVKYTAEYNASLPNEVYKLTMSGTATTKIACSSNLLTAEYSTGINNATHYRLSPAGELMIYYSVDNGLSYKQLRFAKMY